MITAHPRPIHVVIADGHELIRKGVATSLRSFDDIEVCGEAKGGTEAIKLCSQLRPDVALIDVTMPEMDGATVIRLIHYYQPSVNIIVLTYQEAPDLIHAAFEAGAMSYLMKDISADKLVEAIRSAHLGQSTIAHEVAQVLIKKPNECIEGKLTSREQQVLTLLMKGYKNSDIAKELVITLATVKKHVRKILTKLDVESRTQAVAFAYKNDFSISK